MKSLLATTFSLILTTAFCCPCLAQFDRPSKQSYGPTYTIPANGQTNKQGTGFDQGTLKTGPTAKKSNAKNVGGTGDPKPLRLVVGSIPKKVFKDPVQGATFESTGGVTAGLKIIAIHKFGLAQRNGLEVGDVITEVNGHHVDTRRDLIDAFRSLPSNAIQIEVTVVNIRTGHREPMMYELSTEAGVYQSNFGRMELIQTPTNTPGVSILEGRLFFYQGGTSNIKGTLSRGRFRGTSQTNSGQRASFNLTFKGSLAEGTVTQGNRHRFVMVLAN